MSSFAKKLLLVLYFGIVGALLVDYVMGFGWLRGHDWAAMLLVVAAMSGINRWLKSRAAKNAPNGEAVVEALDTEGTVHSDPQTHRFVQQTFAIVIGISVLICLGTVYGDHGQGHLMEDTFVLLTVVAIAMWVCWKHFGNICEVESDDGVTLTLRLRGQTVRVPWSQVESVDVGRPYAFWQVMITFRHLGESKAQTIRFLPLGWRKMAPAAAERLKSALESRFRAVPRSTISGT